ncbi:MAG: hypothetical protein CL610_22800 [Anaerolineaceae bacterium]|nr:hypothetical protein [Anaerolineaceae bacterium]
MDQYTLEDARQHLDKLISDAQHGKTVVIINDDQGVQLVPVSPVRKARRAGSARGLIKLAADFDKPLSDFDEYME